MTSAANEPMTPDEARDLWKGPTPTGERPTPAHALVAARDTFLDNQRVELRALALDLGIGRSTLYRWFGDRDHLIGEMLWGFCEGLFDEAFDHSAQRGLSGPDRISHAIDHFGIRVWGFAPLQNFLTNEPEASLRILTTKASPVQERCVERLAKHIAEEQETGELRDDIAPDALAYAVMRIGEGFLYAGQISGVSYDRNAATRVVRAVLGA